MDAFAKRKAKLKGDDKVGRWFLPLRFYILPQLGCLPILEITQTDICNILSALFFVALALVQTKKKSEKEKYSELTISFKYFTQAAFFTVLRKRKDFVRFATAFAFLCLLFEEEEFPSCDGAALSLQPPKRF